MGKRVVGTLLGMGSERDMVAGHVTAVFNPDASIFQNAEASGILLHLSYISFLLNIDDLFWRELSPFSARL